MNLNLLKEKITNFRRINGKQILLSVIFEEVMSFQMLDEIGYTLEERGKPSKRLKGEKLDQWLIDNIDYVDFTTDKWLALPHEQQVDLSSQYPIWYGRQKGIPVDVGIATLCPPCAYWKGSPANEEGRYEDEVREKVLITKKMMVSKYPVTQEQYQAVMGENPSFFKGVGKLPVENVTWENAQKYCEKVKVDFCKNKASLLSDSEWESVCRAGTTHAYISGDVHKIGEYAWFSENSDQKTHPVGLKKPNAWKLFDMIGNVWEWCDDRKT